MFGALLVWLAMVAIVVAASMRTFKVINHWERRWKEEWDEVEDSSE